MSNLPKTVASWRTQDSPALAELYDRYVETKERADDAAADAKAAATELKNALQLASPGADQIDLLPATGRALQLLYVESSRLDTAKLREQLGDMVDQFTKTSGSWQLRQVRS